MGEDARLAGKIGLVTGGTSGVGLAAAKELVALGAELFITGQRQEEIVEAVRAIGSGVTGIRCIVSEPAELDRLFSEIDEKKGRLDFVISHAGCGELLQLPEFMPLEQITESHYDKCFGSKLKGTLFTVQKALPLMSEGGAIVIDGALVSLKGRPAFGLYAATKAGLHAFARAWAADLRARNVRVNLVTPGVPVGKEPNVDLGFGEEQLALFQEKCASARHAGAVTQTVNAMVFLVSDDSVHISGMELFVDGGAIPI